MGDRRRKAEQGKREMAEYDPAEDGLAMRNGEECCGDRSVFDLDRTEVLSTGFRCGYVLKDVVWYEII